MINQNELRELLKEFLAKTGIKQSFISRAIGLDSNSLAVFKNGAYNLSEENAEKLIKFMEERGVR